MDTSCSTKVECVLGRNKTKLSDMTPEDLLGIVETVCRDSWVAGIDELFKPIAEHSKNEKLLGLAIPAGFTKFTRGQGLGVPTSVAVFPWTERSTQKELSPSWASTAAWCEPWYIYKKLLLLRKDGERFVWAYWSLRYKRWNPYNSDRTEGRLEVSKVCKVGRDQVVRALSRNPQMIGPILDQIMHGCRAHADALINRARWADHLGNEVELAFHNLGGHLMGL